MERVYVQEQWHDVIRSVWRRKPFVVVPVNQTLILDYAVHFHKRDDQGGEEKS